MFEIQVILSALIAWWFAVHLGETPSQRRWTFLLPFFFIVCSVAIAIIFPFLIAQWLALTVVSLWPRAYAHPWRVVGIASALACVGVGTKILFDIQRMRSRYPFESLEHRLPTSLRSFVTALDTRDDFLYDLEAKMDRRLSWWTGDRLANRALELRYLHANTYVAFSRASGFGEFRFAHFARLDEETLVGEEAYPTPDQPEPAFVPAISKDTVKRGNESTRWKPASLDLRFGHHEHLMLFLDPRKFGLVESRQRVAGFQPHGYPGSNSRHLNLLGQKLLRIDLIGAVLHRPPIVYVSNQLPSMKSLGRLHRRPLTPMEREGFRELEQGKNLVTAEGTPDSINVLGAIRATRQCTECHACPRGALLGAFLYSFQ